MVSSSATRTGRRRTLEIRTAGTRSHGSELSRPDTSSSRAAGCRIGAVQRTVTLVARTHARTGDSRVSVASDTGALADHADPATYRASIAESAAERSSAARTPPGPKKRRLPQRAREAAPAAGLSKPRWLRVYRGRNLGDVVVRRRRRRRLRSRLSRLERWPTTSLLSSLLQLGVMRDTPRAGARHSRAPESARSVFSSAGPM